MQQHILITIQIRTIIQVRTLIQVLIHTLVIHIPIINTRPYYYGQRRAGIIGRRRRIGGRRIFDRTDNKGRFGDHTDTTGGFGIRDRIGRRRRIGGINNPYYY